MAGDENVELAKSQANAAWEAVAQARRGISVAWVSVIINFLVVGTALFVPYYQNYLNEQKVEVEKYNEKVELIEDARRAKNDAAIYLKLGILNPAFKSFESRKSPVIYLVLNKLLDHNIDGLENKFPHHSNDYKFRLVVNNLQGVYKSEKIIIDLFESMAQSNRPFDELYFNQVMNEHMNSRNRRLKSISDFIDANTDSAGATRTGDIIIP